MSKPATKAARRGARRIWREGFAYSKAGLITEDLVPLARSQRALPGISQFDRAHSVALMAALDSCNKRSGRGTVVLAAVCFPEAPDLVYQVRDAKPELHNQLGRHACDRLKTVEKDLCSTAGANRSCVRVR